MPIASLYQWENHSPERWAEAGEVGHCHKAEVFSLHSTHVEREKKLQASQWIRICVSMQETQVPSLIPEDPTCHRATKPVCHNY